MQGITALSEGRPFCDSNGDDYLAAFAALELPLLVICAARGATFTLCGRLPSLIMYA